MLIVVTGRGTKPPAARWAYMAIGLLVLQFLNPAGDTLMSRAAQICLYTSVLAPLIWVSRLRVDRKVFKTVLLSLWFFYTTSSVFGVLQVKFPGRFDGAISANYTEEALIPHTFTLADGTKVLRPKGLTDTPGGAGAAGVLTILLGMGLILDSSYVVIRMLALGAMGVGLFCIYICQGRTSLLVAGFAFFVILGILIRRGATGKAILLSYIGFGVATLGTSMAFAIGGQSTIDRFMTLLADDPTAVYQANRGAFLDDLLTRGIFEFPVGAGLGHWGMMHSYFGMSSDTQWAEMLWQALDYDGGIPLIVAYLCLFGSLLWMTWKFAIRKVDNALTGWSAIIFAYTLADFAASFSFPIMSIQSGMELTLLNACLFAAVRSESASTQPQPASQFQTLAEVPSGSMSR